MTPLRGLMAGLLALVVFSSLAVSMTIRGSSTGSAGLGYAPQAAVAVDGGERDHRGGGGDHGDGDGHRR